VVGGVEEIVRQQASLFKRHSNPVKVFAGMGNSLRSDIPVEINPLLSSRHPEILKLQKDPVKNEKELQNFASQILDYLKLSLRKFDVVIVHNVLTMPFNLPFTLALHRLADTRIVKIVSWNHDSVYFYLDIPGSSGNDLWSILKSYHPEISYVTVSENRAREFKELFRTNDEMMVIPNGIDPIRFFKIDPTTVKLIQENDLFQAELLIVQPSRLHPRKNIELSIQVIEAMHDLGTKAKLLLSGAFDPHKRKMTSYYNKLKTMARELKIDEHIIVVTDYKFKNGEQITADRVIIRDLYQISDLLFLPSKQEGFGIPLLEAGMMRMPIACSDIEPFKSIACKNVCYFALNEKPQQIAKKVLVYLENINTHQMYQNVIRNYAWDNIYHQRLLPFLNKIT
jgi:glycosyltransferase involved in cell wall biosynthesis